MKKLIAAAALGSAALVLAACDQNTAEDAREDQLEQQAEEVRAQGEQTAEALEERADGSAPAAEEQLEAQADAELTDAERKAEQLEEQADTVE